MAGKPAYADQEVLNLLDSPLKGILLVSGGIAVFGLQDVIIRSLSGEYAAMEIMFVRGLVALVPMAFLVYWDGGFTSLRVRHPYINLLRGLLMVCSYTAFYMSLAAMPIADVTAIFFVSPLIVTLFSALFLRESVGIRRWSAVIAGFLGVLIIVQPGSSSLDPVALLPLLASVTYAASVVITRRIGRAQTGASLAFIAMLIFIVASSILGGITGDGSFANDSHPSTAFLLRAWVMPDGHDLLLIGSCGLISACGFYCLSQGYRIAQASLVAPFEFISMPMAVIWGIVLWNEYPPATTIIGIAIIIGSGLYALQREAAHRRYLNTGRGVRLRL
ncbi:DMT family transporter [Pelagibius sp. Alg239-R121]|uniref:DMT family transporter n=1 Tax=Pelagibius sp. Alg239-R121 TaxID=2993448 RepID=UPI0024A6B49C|nr:DMT family transporter [Pelagibius sp. Alg239-R121]